MSTIQSKLIIHTIANIQSSKNSH